VTAIVTVVRIVDSGSLAALGHLDVRCEPMRLALARAHLHDPLLKGGNLQEVRYDDSIGSTVAELLQKLHQQHVLAILEDKKPI
jgi:hypothetical protein